MQQALERQHSLSALQQHGGQDLKTTQAQHAAGLKALGSTWSACGEECVQMRVLGAAVRPSCPQCQKGLMEMQTKAQVARVQRWLAMTAKAERMIMKQQMLQLEGAPVVKMVVLELASPAEEKANLSVWTKAALVEVVSQAALGAQGSQQQATPGALVEQLEALGLVDVVDSQQQQERLVVQFQ